MPKDCNICYFPIEGIHIKCSDPSCITEICTDCLKYALKALNNEVLKSSSIKFNVNEIDNIKNKLIKKLGGVSNKKYTITMIMFIIMTLVVIGILLYNIFYKRK